MSKPQTDPTPPGRGPGIEAPGQAERARRYDLEERTLEFARRARAFVRRLPRCAGRLEDGSQLIRASGSVGANYIEANEALGKKDSLMHVRICRKEAKESRYWLELLHLGGEAALEAERSSLAQESLELMRIFAAILRKSQ